MVSIVNSTYANICKMNTLVSFGELLQFWSLRLIAQAYGSGEYGSGEYSEGGGGALANTGVKLLLIGSIATLLICLALVFYFSRRRKK